jgi:hypothetical protein
MFGRAIIEQIAIKNNDSAKIDVMKLEFRPSLGPYD